MRIFVSLLLCSVFFLSCRDQTERNEHPTDSKDLPVSLPTFEITLTADTFPISIDRISGTIYNNSSFDANFGEAFYLEYYKEPSWQKVVFDTGEVNLAFNDVAYGLPAHGWNDFDFNLFHRFHNYQAGRYRVCKDITLTLYAEFCTTDTVSEIKPDKNRPENEALGVVAIPRSLPVSSDSITFSVSNHSTTRIALYNHYFIMKELDNGQWERYYYPSYTKYLWSTQFLYPEEKMDFNIPLMPEKKSLFPGVYKFYKNNYFFHPGRYRLCKYATVHLAKEFVLSDDRSVHDSYFQNREKHLFRYAPVFPGGGDSLNAFFLRHFRVPEKYQKRRKRIDASCGFSVDSLGCIDNIHILATSGDTLFDQEVLRVSGLMPKWLPVVSSHGSQAANAGIWVQYQNGNLSVTP